MNIWFVAGLAALCFFAIPALFYMCTKQFYDAKHRSKLNFLKEIGGNDGSSEEEIKDEG